MTIRAVILGLLLGIAVSALTYFNDAVIRQTMLIGNLFPVGVFGALVLLLLVVNPLLRGRALRTGEIGVLTAIGLAACGWPGANYFRLFTGITARPAQLARDNASWRQAHVLSYLPGGWAEIAEGQVVDWVGLAGELVKGREATADAARRDLWQRMPEDARAIAVKGVERGRLESYESQRLLMVLNELIDSGELYKEPARAGVDLGAEGARLEARARELEEARQRRLAAVGPLMQQRDEQRAKVQSERSKLQEELAGLQKRAEEQRAALAALRQAEDQLTQRLEQARSAAFRLGREAEGDTREGLAGGAAAEQEKVAQELEERAAEIKRRKVEAEAALQATNKGLTALGEELAELDYPANRLSDRAKLQKLWSDHYEFELGRLRRQGSRQVLMAMFPQHILAAPVGGGWLVSGGEADPFAVGLLGGWDGELMLRPTDLPWGIWWPTLRLWGTLALLMGLAAVCLALVVHPQWSRRELLPYPIARFVQEIGERQAGQLLPEVAHSKLFWLAFVVVLSLHTINGLWTWFPNSIQVPLAYDFYPLRKLFPEGSKAAMAWASFYPQIFFSVIGFAFFLRTEMSLSLGVIGLFYMGLASIVFRQGVPLLQDNWLQPNNFTMVLFGAWLGGFLIVLYIGRRYYSSVAASAMGLPRQAEVPAYSVWAARGLILCGLGAIWVLSLHGLDWVLSVLVVGLILMLFLVISRINAETGAFFIQPGWMPVAVFTAVFGDQALGPTAYLLLALVGVVMVTDPREALMPYLTNGLQMADQTDTPPRRVAPWLMAMVVVGFMVALVVTLSIQYNRGLNLSDDWAVKSVPSNAPDNASRVINDLSARDQLGTSVSVSGLKRFAVMKPDGVALAWMGLGVGLVLATALARLRLSWWPLHPVIFMVFGTMSSMRFSSSFLIGWAIKAGVVRLGGSKSYRAVRPLMVGMIAGEVVAALLWIGVGAIYYWITGLEPKQYAIFPG